VEMRNQHLGRVVLVQIDDVAAQVQGVHASACVAPEQERDHKNRDTGANNRASSTVWM
jgi:hypothetical protein